MSITPPSYPLSLSDSPQEKVSSEEYLRREKAIKGTEERFLYGENSDEEGWRSEALAVIDDIQQFVKEISISIILPCNNNGIYLNVETKENIQLTVELSSAGFRVCGQGFDTLLDLKENEQIQIGDGIKVQLNSYYETPYSLLDSISPSYRNSFCTELAQRLVELCDLGKNDKQN